jgi:hypothetical protein
MTGFRCAVRRGCMVLASFSLHLQRSSNVKSERTGTDTGAG